MADFTFKIINVYFNLSRPVIFFIEIRENFDQTATIAKRTSICIVKYLLRESISFQVRLYL